MSRPTWVLSLLPALALCACTVDDGTIEDKKCDLTRPSDSQCLKGYYCHCEETSNPDRCFCLPQSKSALAVPPMSAGGQVPAIAGAADSPSRRFLQRHYSLE